MTNSIIEIEINPSQVSSFDKPLLKWLNEKDPSLVTFDFDNFSEETIRQYALDLAKQSHRVAIVLRSGLEDSPYSALVQFFNRLQQLRHPRLLIVQHGSVPGPLQKMLRVIGGEKYLLFDDQTPQPKLGDQILNFLQSP